MASPGCRGHGVFRIPVTLSEGVKGASPSGQGALYRCAVVMAPASGDIFSVTVSTVNPGNSRRLLGGMHCHPAGEKAGDSVINARRRLRGQWRRHPWRKMCQWRIPIRPITTPIVPPWRPRRTATPAGPISARLRQTWNPGRAVSWSPAPRPSSKPSPVALEMCIQRPFFRRTR